MKRYFLFASVMLALAAVSCNGGGNGSTSGNVSQSSEGQPVADSVAQAQAQDNAATPSVLMPGAVGNGNASASATAPEKKKLEAPKVPVTPETPTDKLIKQYNDELVALIQSSQQDGKLDEAKVKAFAHLGKQIEALDKEGKLSTNQKELFKVASDAYTKLINKNQ